MVARMDHLAIPVSDQERSRRFYETHTSGSTRGHLDATTTRDRLVADGIELVEQWDEPDYVSVKCRDPDGHIVEASWEPDA